MKKALLIVPLVLLVIHSYSQIKFEKGYFIDNDGSKVEGLIKNYDWTKNPTEIEYKSDENSESKLFTAFSIKEFGIYNSSRYVISTVNIDRSASEISAISASPNPVFKEERLFLKVLVEGKANLYSYEEGDLKRFFFNIDESKIEQLIFKLYRGNSKVGSSNTISENNRFRQQLWNSLTCSSIERKKLENLNYHKKDLIKVFFTYNTCSGSNVTTFENKVDRQKFTVSVRPRLNFASLSASNPMDKSYTFDWGSKMGFGIGIEGEFFLPVNKNKWSFLIEPTYQSFVGSTTSSDYSGPSGILVADVEYTSIELPVGVRHYFFLSDRSQIFVNVSFVFDFATSSSQLEITRPSGYPISLLEISGGSALAFGAGFKHNAFSIEVRYLTKRDPLNNYMAWEGEYKTLSVVLGYSIFRKKS